MKLNYNHLKEEYIEVINYATKTCDVFSIITNQRKPYSKLPPVCDYENTLNKLESSLVKQIVGIKAWPASASKDNHKVMNIYSCNKISRMSLMALPNIFDAINNSLPEDICFYREGIAWLVTVTHEEYGFIYYENKNDINFLIENKIQFYVDGINIKYPLHK